MDNVKKYIISYRKELIGFGMLLFLFISLSLLVLFDKVFYIDSSVHSYILEIRTDNLTSFISIITELGGASFLLATSIILLILMKKKKIALFIFINLISSFIVNETVKTIFMRSRPIGINLIDETGFSFPSGHSMVALSFYGFIAYLLFRKVHNKFARCLIIICLLILVLSIGLSRIYLGVHYLSDIVAGFLLSLMYLIIFINVIKLERE